MFPTKPLSAEKTRRVQFFPRQVIEGMPHGDPRTALISITDPGDPARLPEGWAAVLRLEFDDVAPPFPVLIRDGNHHRDIAPFDASMAAQVLEFVGAVPQDVNRVIVHCNAGISRSAAVARFLADYYGYRLHDKAEWANRHVLSVLYKAAGQGAGS
jgi:predicted protein tyrosine phosphatase